MHRCLTQKDAGLSSLHKSLLFSEQASYDGVFLWKITDVGRKLQDSVTGRTVSLYSPGKTRYIIGVLAKPSPLENQPISLERCFFLLMWTGGPLKWLLKLRCCLCKDFMLSCLQSRAAVMCSSRELCSILGFHFATCPLPQLLAVTSAGSVSSHPRLGACGTEWLSAAVISHVRSNLIR